MVNQDDLEDGNQTVYEDEESKAKKPLKYFVNIDCEDSLFSFSK